MSNRPFPTSNDSLIHFLEDCPPEDLHLLITLLHSRLSKQSRALNAEYPTSNDIPPPQTPDRTELSHRIVSLLGWYGSNSLVYAYRKCTHTFSGKPYLGICNDVATILNKRFPKKKRRTLPIVASVPELEQLIVELLLQATFQGKSTEELSQILQESGLEEKAAEEAAKKYGPAGFAAASLPLLTKFLGKKTVMNIIQQLIIAFFGRFVGKEAARIAAARIVIIFSQKLLTRFINVIGWFLLAADTAFFVSSPARRITIKVIPCLALLRLRDRLDDDDTLTEAS